MTFWQALRSSNVEEGLVQAIQALYENSAAGAGQVPLEQSARGVLQDNSRCPLGMLTLTYPLQLCPREDHEGNTP